MRTRGEDRTGDLTLSAPFFPPVTPPSPQPALRWRALLGDVHFWIPVAVLLLGLLVLRWIA